MVEFMVKWSISPICIRAGYASGDSRNKTRPSKVVVVANSKQKCSFRTHNVVKYTSKNFGYYYTLFCEDGEDAKQVVMIFTSSPTSGFIKQKYENQLQA